MIVESYRKSFPGVKSCCLKLQWRSGPSDDPPGDPLWVLEPLNPPQLTDSNHLGTRDLRAGGLKVAPLANVSRFLCIHLLAESSYTFTLSSYPGWCLCSFLWLVPHFLPSSSAAPDWWVLAERTPSLFAACLKATQAWFSSRTPQKQKMLIGLGQRQLRYSYFFSFQQFLYVVANFWVWVEFEFSWFL